jgi:ABC-2 type transport system ATP-binding protein
MQTCTDTIRDCTEMALEASDLTKRFDTIVALNHFDLSVAAGEIVGLVGHNGAGKTTFARAVAGLLRLNSGVIRVNGATQVRKYRPELGLAPQEIALYPTATARENLHLFAGLFGLRRFDAVVRIKELASSLFLEDVLDRRVKNLSGGQQRRLQTATAMVHRPRILLLDEPTVGADPITRDALLGVVKSSAADGTAVIYTTHYLPELDVLDATLAVAERGRVIARGTRAALLASVPGRAIIEFNGHAPHDMKILSGQLDRDRKCLTITVADPAGSLAPFLVANPSISQYLRSIEVQTPTLDDLYRHLVRA